MNRAHGLVRRRAGREGCFVPRITGPMQTTSASVLGAPVTHVAPVAWSAVGSMTLCVALLIAAEFMPVSLLTPIAQDLHATSGMTGQAISISGLFAVLTS